jgi:hypothetical protein
MTDSMHPTRPAIRAGFMPKEILRAPEGFLARMRKAEDHEVDNLLDQMLFKHVADDGRLPIIIQEINRRIDRKEAEAAAAKAHAESQRAQDRAEKADRRAVFSMWVSALVGAMQIIKTLADWVR